MMILSLTSFLGLRRDCIRVFLFALLWMETVEASLNIIQKLLVLEKLLMVATLYLD